MNDQRTVLVVGTDQTAIETLASVLRSIGGVAVRVAHDVLASDAPDVVVVHGAAAERSAIELARSVRARRGPSAPRIVWIPTTEPRRVELVHFDEVVRRPYRAVDLVDRVRRLLRSASGTFARVPAVRRERGTG